MHPKASWRNKSARSTGDLSSKELLKKIKRFNSLVKHYFFGHHTVAFNLCTETARVLARTVMHWGIGRGFWLTSTQCKGLVAFASVRKKVREPVEQL